LYFFHFSLFVHTTDVNALHANTAPLFAQLAPLWQLVRTAVGADPAEKHRHLWRFTIADLVASAVYREWLCTHRLLTLAEASEAIGYFEAGGIDVEDYLIGVTALPKELSRLCVNCVTRGNYELPQTISNFVSDLYSAFQILNLRNDALRKKYDAIKYDLTSIEQVMYDISVRRLAAGAAASSSAAAAGDMSDVVQQSAASAP
jgi:hypothetical protein